jgi:hypothetical protein
MIALAQFFGNAANAGGVLSGRLHHAPKARRVIQLFMNGGVSPMDTFRLQAGACAIAWPETRSEGATGRADRRLRRVDEISF